MVTKFVEVTNGPQNWGKFMVCRFDHEWQIRSHVGNTSSLLRTVGWTTKHIAVFDLQTGEGAIFMPGGVAAADLNAHRIWVCPMYEPFLAWLYTQDLSDLSKLPDHLDLPEAEFELFGHRRPGPK